MFQVQRYDPTKRKNVEKAGETTVVKADKKLGQPTSQQITPKSTKLSKKRQRQQQQTKQQHKKNDEKTPQNDTKSADNNIIEESDEPSEHVIAPEAQAPEVKRHKKSTIISDEAFDDLDVYVDDIVEEDEAESSAPTVSTNNKTASLVKKPVELENVREADVNEALQMANLPIKQAAQTWNLAPFLVENLIKDKFSNFFPIQAFVIPNVIISQQLSHIRARDVCITAPTGSGKTLAYVLPVLNSLANRVVRRLRALVVLPSQDLALQVYKVFQQYMLGSDLRVGLAVGQSSLRAEQVALTVANDLPIAEAARRKLHFDRTNLDLALEAFHPMNHSNDNRVYPDAIDVLVCTPGRLMEHLERTPHFSLQHLQLLIVDEADRLLGQSYSNWIDRVLDNANSGSIKMWETVLNNTDHKMPDLKLSNDECSYLLDPITWRRGGTMRDEDGDFNTNTACLAAVGSVCQPVQLRKFLVSATMTRDPQKLASLRLVNPLYFDVHQLGAGNKSESNNVYSMPASLQEYTIECTAEQKPLVLLAILLEQLEKKKESYSSEKTKGVSIVFTSSLMSTHRLARLLQLLWVSAGYGTIDDVAEFSSALDRKGRTKLLKRCQDVDDPLVVVVCSDGMSRGMDIELATTVINYDIPKLAKTYVHRCGRTARAGRSGTAVCILKKDQVPLYNQLRELVQEPERVKPWKIQKHLLQNAVPHYQRCVATLKRVLEAENVGELRPTERLPDHVFEDEDDDEVEGNEEVDDDDGEESI